ncbi:MAG TPA: hypothetical protein P5092_05420 [Ruminococcus sp.]|nr:hypothetical protein [Ruminococcus sp.]
MKNKKTMKQAAALLLTIAAVAVPVVPSAQPLSASAISNADVLGISVSGVTAPTGNLTQGKPYIITGNVSSKYTIDMIYGGIYSSDGKTKVIYCEDYPNSTTYNFRTYLDNKLTFDSLAPGSYVYRVFARTVQDDAVIAESQFTVGNGSTAQTTASASNADVLGISVSGVTAPTGNLTQGKPYIITGNVSSKYTIDMIYGGIYSSDGKTKVIYCEDYPNSTTYNFRTYLDNKLTFDSLAPGSYVYRVFARTVQDDAVIAESQFTVGNGSTAQTTASASNASIAVSGKIVPSGNIAQGKPYIIGGILSSTSNITQVYGGVYSADGKTSVLYCSDTPNSTSYDLRKKFDNSLTFNTLPAGSYVYKITAKTAGGEAVVAESKFTVGNGTAAAQTPANTAITVSGKIVPSGNLTQGKPYIIGGILSSTANITQVYGGVYSADGKTSVLYCTDNPNSTSYDLRRKFDNSLTFNTLPAGSYVYKITAKTAGGEAVVAESPFTVGNGGTATQNASVTVSGSIVPSGKLTQGKPYIIGGIINSNAAITQVYGGVYSADGKTSVLYCTDNPNSTSYDLRRKFDNSLTFNTLPAGSYVYKITAKTAGGEAVVAESPFTVGNGGTATQNASVTVSGSIVPSGKLTQGKPYIIGGIINSNAAITQVYGGVYTAGGRTSVLYCTDNPNSTSYDLRKKFDNAITFNTLPSGSYRYKITVKTASGDTVIADSQFTV